MTKRIKCIGIIALIVVVAITAMTSTISADVTNSSIMPTSVESKWEVIFGYAPPACKGFVTGLSPWSDGGLTFECTGYYTYGGNSLYAIGQLDPAYEFLNLYPNNYTTLSYKGAKGALWFIDNWYQVNDGTVGYVVTVYGSAMGQGMGGRVY